MTKSQDSFQIFFIKFGFIFLIMVMLEGGITKADAARYVDEYGRRPWAIMRGDGEKLIIAETLLDDGRGILASMFIEERGNRPLSKKRKPADSSRRGLQPSPEDTGGGLSNRPGRSPQVENTPGAPGRETIEDSGGNVNKRPRPSPSLSHSPLRHSHAGGNPVPLRFVFHAMRFVHELTSVYNKEWHNSSEKILF